MGMLDVEVLKDFDWDDALLLGFGLGVQDFSEGLGQKRKDKFIFVMDVVSVFIIFFSEKPSIDSFGNGKLFFSEKS